MPTMHHREVTAREAAENILKTIMKLHIRCGHAYVSEVAEELEMNLTTTYTVVAQMAKDDLLQPLEGGRGRRAQKQSLNFTPNGEELAQSVFERHQTIQKWLNRLGISMEEADAEACSMEHGITERTMRLLQNHVRIATEMAQGTQEDSALNMQQMLLQKTSHTQASEKTFSESTMEFLENLGGIEGIARKQALLDRAQGEENLQLILELTEEIGAPDEIRAKYADYIYCKDMEETCGGWDEICETKKLVDELGGRETLAELLRLAERFGGVEPLMKLADQQYRLWDGIFEGKRKEEYRPDRT